MSPIKKMVLILVIAISTVINYSIVSSDNSTRSSIGYGYIGSGGSIGGHK